MNTAQPFKHAVKRIKTYGRSGHMVALRQDRMQPHIFHISPSRTNAPINPYFAKNDTIGKSSRKVVVALRLRTTHNKSIIISGSEWHPRTCSFSVVFHCYG